MNKIIINMLATAISIIISALMLLIVNGLLMDGRSVIYAVGMSLIQMFFPFLIFVITVRWIFEKMSIKKRSPIIQFFLFVVVAILILVSFYIWEIFTMDEKRSFSYYFKEFGLFMCFAVIVPVILYFLDWKKSQL